MTHDELKKLASSDKDVVNPKINQVTPEEPKN